LSTYCYFYLRRAYIRSGGKVVNPWGALEPNAVANDDAGAAEPGRYV
jgi:hypothetical protein